MHHRRNRGTGARRHDRWRLVGEHRSDRLLCVGNGFVVLDLHLGEFRGLAPHALELGLGLCGGLLEQLGLQR